MPDEKESRSDAGQERVPGAKNAERILIYIPGHGNGPRISKALRDDLKIQKRTNPHATISTVLIGWIAEHLGLKP